MFTRPDNWQKMSQLERRKARLDAWQQAPVQFASPEAQANYHGAHLTAAKNLRPGAA